MSTSWNIPGTPVFGGDEARVQMLQKSLAATQAMGDANAKCVLPPARRVRARVHARMHACMHRHRCRRR